MAPIVNQTSDIYRDYLDDSAVSPDNVQANGSLQVITGTVANAADDLQNSTYKLCELPSECMIDPHTFFDVENWGYADVRIGTMTDVDALVSQTRASEALVEPIVKGDANHGKRLWEILGLAENPGGWIEIFAHGSQANPTAAGSMPFQIKYIWN